MIDEIIGVNKKPTKSEPKDTARYQKFFPPEYSQKQMDAVITKLLTEWKGKVVV